MTGKWRKSSRSQSGNSGSCVEFRLSDGHVQIKDSKLTDSPILTLPYAEIARQMLAIHEARNGR